MKRGIAFLMVAAIFVSCKKEDKVEGPDNNNEGRYELVEVLMDPGDGSGTFQPVNSNKFVELLANGTIESNGDICTMDIGSSAATSGTYSLADSTIVIQACDTLSFDLTDSTLIINYPCIEPCRAKYRKAAPLFPN